MTEYTPVPCRLCGGMADHRFVLRVMGRLSVGYYECRTCRSLQTEKPYWIDEAYADATRYTDTFIGQRLTTLPPIVLSTALAAGIDGTGRLLDWGGGNGMITRVLRDLGFDAYSYDPFEAPSCCPGFDGAPGRDYPVITAFEVLEHMTEPGKELEAVFACEPELFIATTCLYNGQGTDWIYLAPYSGRHVFFFSRDALDYVARRHGYGVIVNGNYIIFHKKPLSPLRRALLKAGLRPFGRKAWRAWLNLRPPHGRSESDREAMRLKVHDFGDIGSGAPCEPESLNDKVKTE